ncbi:MAG: energy transducer TonB [Rhodothermales bacterium]
MKPLSNRQEHRDYYYRLRLQTGFVISLLFLIAASSANITSDIVVEEKVAAATLISMIEIPPTVIEKKIQPAAPRIPVVVADDVVLDDDDFSFDHVLDIETAQVIEGPPAVKADERDESLPFLLVEEMPELLGGLAALLKEIRYPEMAKKAGVEGKVFVQFVVDKNGIVLNPQVVRSIGAGCDEEALRALAKMKFNPGKQRGMPVAVRMTIPTVFKLR